jgi:acetolactate synthase-1/2/3 large subunit
MALVNVTTGPGGINALNGVFGAYTDSVPMLVISGQVKTETVAAFQPLPLRQLGDQEVDILAMAAPVTKFSASLRDPADTAYLIEKAIWIARSGRPGPVWIDVPIDIQGAQVDPDRLRHFSAAAEGAASHPNEAGRLVGPDLVAASRRVLDLIGTAERPVILPGTGIRAAKAVALFARLVETLRIPVATAFNAHDLLTDDHPAYVGKAGTVGDRAGNFAVQNADLVLVLGCRLNIRQISYNWTAFARAATQVMVDIDSAELAKHTLSIDVPVQADLSEFLEALLAQAENHAPPAAHAAYLAWCKVRTARYPANLPDYALRNEPIHPYAFAGLLWDELGEGGRGGDRQCHGLHRHVPDRAAEAAPAPVLEFGVGVHGLRPARRHRRSPRLGRDRAHRLHGRRRQHHDESAGTADDRRQPPADQDLHSQQCRLLLDPPVADRVVPR